MKNPKSLALIIFTLFVGFTSCKENDSPDDGTVITPEETISQVTEQLKDKQELSTFSDALKTVSLSQDEVSEGLTVFAPTNAAISNYNPAVAASKQNTVYATDTTQKLTSAVLKDHIVKGVFKPADLTDGKTFTSLSGKQFRIAREGDSIRVNGVLLTLAATGSNEMIYTVNKILSQTKTTDTVSNSVQACLVSKINFPADTSYTTFEYDSQNRVTKVDNFYKGKIDESYTYVYSGNTVTATLREENIIEETTTFQLNNGLATAATSEQLDTVRVTTRDSIKNETRTDLYFRNTVIVQAYQRNAEGFLTRRITTTNTSSSEPGFRTTSTKDTITYTYSNGNLIQEVESSGSYRTTKTFEYYTDKANSLPVDEFFVNKPSKNAVKKITYSFIYNGAPAGTDSMSYTYVYNAAGLITKQNAIYQAGQQQQTDSADIEYGCR